MNAVFLLLLVIRSLGEFQVHDVASSSSKRFPAGFTIDNAPLPPVSACRFEAKNKIVLIGEDGTLLRAHVSQRDGTLNVSFTKRLRLSIPGRETVESKGCARKSDGRLFVRTEDPLGVTAFDSETGESVSFGKLIYSKYGINSTLGFEALTFSRIFGGKEQLVTTTADAAGGIHYLMHWESDSDALKIKNKTYEASYYEFEKQRLDVVELESLDSSLLVLEQFYKKDSCLIVRLFELQYRGKRKDRPKSKQLFQLEGPKSGDENIDVGIENFTAMCLSPDKRTIILVSNDKQKLGTLFVALRVSIGDKGAHENPWLWLLPVGVFSIIAICICVCIFKDSKPPIVLTEDGDQIELSFDMANLTATRRQGNGADFSRVATDPDSIQDDTDEDDHARLPGKPIEFVV